MKIKPTLILLPALISSLIFQFGCSYDNTLYNARKYFKSAQNRPLNQQGRPTPQAIDEYNKTIQKTGYILTERKNSAEADDALFLLARALYYKGNSQYQAKDQFESLLRNFPNSPYAPDATLYLAKSFRQINAPDEAEKLLAAYIRQPDKAKWHPQALLLLADFAVQDKDNVKSQFWLERLLTQYPKSIHAKEASFLLGKTLFDQKDYVNSLAQFKQVMDTRGISRIMKNDARYYIALNQFYLDDCQKCLLTANKLIKDEERQDKWPNIRVLIGRALLETDKETEAIELLQEIIKNNARTLASAEACFWLAEFYYYRQQDLQKAMENYNKVKSESAGSPYAEEATQKYNALNLIKQKATVSWESDPRQYLDNRLEIANQFFKVLNLPDSAFTVFDKIQALPARLQTEIDSLNIIVNNLQVRMDSLSAMPDSIVVPKSVDPDSLTMIEDSIKIVVSPDSSSLVQKDAVIPDALQLSEYDLKDHPDSLETDVKTELATEPDSLLSIEPAADMKDDDLPLQTTKPSTAISDSLNQIKTILDNAEARKTTLQEHKEIFATELIPYALFVKAAMIFNTYPESALLQPLYELMETQYPDSKYVQAAKMMLEGKPVRIIDQDLENQEMLLESALSLIVENPDSALVVLDGLTRSDYQNISARTNFRLGWFYSFEQQDTVKAKAYLDEIAKLDSSNEYHQAMSRFYNGTKYTINFNEEELDILSDAVQDTLIDSTRVDSLSQQTLPDSTDQKSELPELKPETEEIPEQPDEQSEEQKNHLEDSPPGLLPPEKPDFRKPE